MPRIVDHDARRSGLADAAATVIAAAGLDATGLREVARQSALTTGAVTHYFDSKADLIEAAYDAVMARLAERQQQGPAVETLTPEALARHIAGFLPIDAEAMRDWRVWLAFSARALVDPRLQARHRQAYARITATLMAEAGNAPEAGVIADAIVAMVDGLAIRMMLEPGDWPLARIEAVLMAVTPMFLERENV